MASEELTPEQLSAMLSGSLPEIKGYRVLRRIGRGGMSYVYLCVQESLDRLVAIKIISPDALVDEVSKQRFESEARTIAKLEHPGIVSIHEVGRTPQGLLYYVMPYLPKGHLGQTDFTKDEGKVAEILRSLLSALGYLHERGIVHRDVKADNVLFDSADRPLLTDFGIALSRADTARITTAGLALGSGGYMAPEQARGEAVDGRADLYAVGVLAFELLTGRLPFLGTDALSQALMHASDPIPRLPSELKHWQPFIDKAMAKNAAKRFQNTADMLRALDRAYSHEQYTSRQTQAVNAMDFRGMGGGRRKALIAVAATLAVAALAYGGWKFSSKPVPAEDSPVATAVTTPAPAAADASATPADPVATDPATADPAAADPAAVDPAAAATPTADDESTPAADAPLVSAVGDFSKVQGQLLFNPLGYDPTIPGARQITAAKRQLGQKRVTSPAGDNAIESLSALHKLAPEDPALSPLADEAITAVAQTLVESVEGRRDAPARSSYQMTERFVRQAGRGDSEPWKALQATLAPMLLKRLEADARSGDAAAGAATKALAGVFKVPQSQLEPAWSQASVQPRAVVASAGAGAPPFVTVGGVGGETISVMREEVTRGEYGQFVTATNRPETTCRNRNLPFALRKKHWNDPGFPQENSHPVVCVSHVDALAYAQWLGQRTGNTYRLPRRSEWQVIASYSASDDACSNGHIGCGNRGTAPARRGPASPAGINGLQGNVREWLSDCDGGCKRRLAAGLGWRDGAKNADAGRSAGLDGESGYDDIGFRLIRE